MGTIANGKNTPLNAQSGSLPNMNGAMQSYFQPMVFMRVQKIVRGGQVVEIGTPIDFRGVMQPFTDQQLKLKPEGQRAWRWFWVHSDPVLSLTNDEVITYQGIQTRVMAKKDYSVYGYMEYHLVQDWTGAGPEVVVTP